MNKSKNSIVDPKVTIEIHGVQQDNNKKQTKVIENNGKGISSMLCSPGAVTLWLPVAEFSLPRLLPFNQTCPGALKPSHTTQIHEMFLAYFSAGALFIDCWCHELAPQIDVPMDSYFQGFFCIFLEKEIPCKTSSAIRVSLRLAANSAELELWRCSLPPYSWT